jgi:hypothetical protein
MKKPFSEEVLNPEPFNLAKNIFRMTSRFRILHTGINLKLDCIYTVVTFCTTDYSALNTEEICIAWWYSSR